MRFYKKITRLNYLFRLVLCTFLFTFSAVTDSVLVGKQPPFYIKSATKITCKHRFNWKYFCLFNLSVSPSLLLNFSDTPQKNLFPRLFKSLLFSVIIIKGHRLVSFDIMAEKSGFPRTKAYALRQAGAGRQFTGLSPFPPVQIPFIFCDNYQRTPLGCPLILWRRNRDLNPSYAINVLLP